ncbi:DNA/RNA non-specific endonuclease [Clostridium perfringens]
MREVAINYSNTEELINKLRVVLNNLDNEKREISNALSELYDLQNYYSNKGSIVDELESKQGQINRDIETTESLIMSITSFMQEVREKDERLAYKFKQDIKEYAKNNKIDLVSDVDRFLDKLQTGLDIAGFIPIVGDIGDGINAFISLLRGDVSGAILSAVSILPFGDAVKGLKYIDNAKGLLKLGDKAVDIGKGTVKLAKEKGEKSLKKYVLEIASKGEEVFKEKLGSTLSLGNGDYAVWMKGKGDNFVDFGKSTFKKINEKMPEGIRLCLEEGKCLVGDTLVKTDKGMKKIREIEIGDSVLSRNNTLGINEYKKVIDIHINSTYESFIIKTKNSIIESTLGHLFMVKDKWWKAAVDIKENDYLELSDGRFEEVVEVRFERKEYPIKVYNITVEGNHNYYTSQEQILTHNMNQKRCKILNNIVNQSNSKINKKSLDELKKVKYGEQYTKVNGKKALKSNVEYVTDEGYRYLTDSKGRISDVEGTLKRGKAKRNAYAQRTVGKEQGRLASDDGGHLIASIFKGSGDLDNLVPMDSTLNRGEWKSMESSWAKALEDGKKVDIKIKPIYNEPTQRPTSFKVKYRMDNGRWVKEIFTN